MHQCHGSAVKSAIRRFARHVPASLLPDRPCLLLLVGGLVLPNVPALCIDTVAGVPPRTSAIALYAALALLAGRLPAHALVPLGLLAMVVDLVSAVARMFFLDPDALMHLIDLDVLGTLMATPVYAAGALAAVGIMLAYLAFLVRAGPAMRRAAAPSSRRRWPRCWSATASSTAPRPTISAPWRAPARPSNRAAPGPGSMNCPTGLGRRAGS